MKDVTEFYHIACAIVKGWPATYAAAGEHEQAAKRPNSFAIMRSLLDLEAANLAKAVEHARPPFLFIRGYDGNAYRSGIKIEYPLVGCAEDSLTFFHATGEGGMQKQRQRTNLFLIDQLPYKESGYSDAYSAGRAIEEVGRDLRQMLIKFMAALKNWEYVEFTSGPYTDGWHDTTWLRAHGEPADWETVEALTDTIVGVNQVDGDIIYQGSDNNAILITNLIVESDYCPPTVEFNYNYTASPFEAMTEKWRDDI